MQQYGGQNQYYNMLGVMQTSARANPAIDYSAYYRQILGTPNPAPLKASVVESTPTKDPNVDKKKFGFWQMVGIVIAMALLKMAWPKIKPLFKSVRNEVNEVLKGY